MHISLPVVMKPDKSWSRPIKISGNIWCCWSWHISAINYFFLKFRPRQFLPQARSREETHDDAINWKHFPRYGPFVRRIHRSPMDSPYKGQWRGSLICTWTNGWTSNGDAGELRRHGAHYDVIVTNDMTVAIEDTPPKWSQTWKQRRVGVMSIFCKAISIDTP